MAAHPPPPAHQPGPAAATPGPVRGRLQLPAPPPIPTRPSDPALAYQTRPKATPAARHDTHDRVRHDRIDTHGKVTLRVNGRLHHIGIGRTHARTPVLLLVQDLQVRVVNAATGELLRQLVIDPARNYQPNHPSHAKTTSPRTQTEGSG